MKLYYHKDPNGNFGDDLNPWLFDRLLPGAFSGHCFHDPKARSPNDEDDDLLIGIGTLLNSAIPTRPKKIVFGSGVGYGAPPTINDSWDLICVRGPKTARALGQDESLAITDPAVLCRQFIEPADTKKSHSYSFMPHCATARRGYWQEVCRELGVNFIDPRRPVDEVLVEISATEILISEALHGAILADSLRVPWIPVTSNPLVLEFKWADWCESMSLAYEPCRLPALWEPGEAAGLIQSARKLAKHHLAKRALKGTIVKEIPVLSDERMLLGSIERLEERLATFRATIGVTHG